MAYCWCLANNLKTVQRAREKSSKPRFDPSIRANQRPKIFFSEGLPVVERREEIAQAIQKHQVVVICGETGSGKTTQLPKICLEIGRGLNGLIGHTQPRRIAARTVASRIAEELQVPLGGAVGFKIRFTDITKPETFIKLMTDGILLAETQTDRDLRQYDTIIIDEAHERSLNIDFLLGYLKRLLPRRPDLKVIITSATIDPIRFSKHFNDAPVIEVSGRTFPVETLYLPLSIDERTPEDTTEPTPDSPADADLTEIEGIVTAIRELWSHNRGDTLVFLPTERDIRETAEALEGQGFAADILPLYSRLSSQEQMRVFHPDRKRARIILATNVAETSVTVPGIKYVVDVGLARLSRYSPRTKVQRLPIEPISQASADQRKGRCGRVSAGVCVRLYSEQDYLSRPKYTDPEILRTNLASVILQMMWLRLGKIEEFPFIDPPDYRQIRDGLATLHELGAVDEEDRLTEIGKRLAKLPVDPRVGRMIVGGQDEHCAEQILVIAAALSVQDVRERPIDQQDAADQAHQKFRDEQSDFISILKLWRGVREQQRDLSNNQFRKWCRSNFISYMRFREWIDIHQQLCSMTDIRPWADRTTAIRKIAQQPDGDLFPQPLRDKIHRALVPALLNNIAMKTDAATYTGARQTKLNIWPGSALFKNRPLWMMSAELVETNRLYARTIAPAKVEWIERAARHLVKRSHSDPHWHAPSGNVIASEKVLLYGLLLIPRRNVNYGAIDPVLSRQLFIQHALVASEFRTENPALLKNRKSIELINTWQNKLRRRDLLTDDQTRYNFFDARVPRDVYSSITFDKWAGRGSGSNWHQLELTDRELLDQHVANDLWHGLPGRDDKQHGLETHATISQLTTRIIQAFPDQLKFENQIVPLTYKYEPGEEDDGITITTSLASLEFLQDGRMEWLVQGLLQAKVEELIRSLPKRLRTQFVPVNEAAKKVIEKLPPFGVGSLIDAVAGILWKTSGQPIARSDFQLDNLPPFLSMNYRVVDVKGAVIAEGRDLPAIRQKLGQKVRATFTSLSDPRYTKENLKQWDFGDLPERVEIEHAGVKLFGYPTLIEDGENVSLKLLDSPESSELQMPSGLRRLFMLQTSKELKNTLRDLPDLEWLRLNYRPFGSGEELMSDLTLLTADRAFFSVHKKVRTHDEFADLAGAAWKRLYEVSRAYGRVLKEILERNKTLSAVLSRTYPPLLLDSIEDMRQQLKMLLPKRFLATTPGEKLDQMPRYLKGLDIRITRLTNAGLSKDMQGLGIIRPVMERYLDLTRKHALRGIIDPALMEFRWLIEEYRLQIFSQEIKTIVPVSDKRIEQAWAAVKKI